MSRFLFDEDVHHAIVRGVRLRRPNLVAQFVEDVLTPGAEDVELLDFAVREDYILVTHDANMLVRHAWNRIVDKQPMPGLVVVRQSLPLGNVIGDLITLSDTLGDHEWSGQIHYFPL